MKDFTTSFTSHNHSNDSRAVTATMDLSLGKYIYILYIYILGYIYTYIYIYIGIYIYTYIYIIYIYIYIYICLSVCLSAWNLLDPETKNLNFVCTEPRTQQMENGDPRAAFLSSFLPRPQQPSHLRTQVMT